MSEENRNFHYAESEESGLLLSVEPIPGYSVDIAAVNADDDNTPADTDTDDTVGDTDYNDDTDTDTADDADGTD